MTRAEAAALAQSDAQGRNEAAPLNGTSGTPVNGAPINGVVSPPGPPPVNQEAPPMEAQSVDLPLVTGMEIEKNGAPADSPAAQAEPPAPAAAPGPAPAVMGSGATAPIFVAVVPNDADIDDFGANDEPLEQGNRGDFAPGLSPLVLEAEDPFLAVEQVAVRSPGGHRAVDELDAVEAEEEPSEARASDLLLDSEQVQFSTTEPSDTSELKGPTHEAPESVVPPHELAGQEGSLDDIKSSYVEIKIEPGLSQEGQGSSLDGSQDSEAEFSVVDQVTKSVEQLVDQVDDVGNVELAEQNEQAEIESDDSEGGSSGLATTDVQPLAADVNASEAAEAVPSASEELYFTLVPEAALSMGSEATVSMEFTNESHGGTERSTTDAFASNGLIFDASRNGHATNGHVMNGVLHGEPTPQIGEAQQLEFVTEPAEEEVTEPAEEEGVLQKELLQEIAADPSDTQSSLDNGSGTLEKPSATLSGPEPVHPGEDTDELSEPTVDETLTAALETVLANFSEESSDESQNELDQAAPLAVFAPPSPMAMSSSVVDLPPPPVPPKLDVLPPPGFQAPVIGDTGTVAPIPPPPVQNLAELGPQGSASLTGSPLEMAFGEPGLSPSPPEGVTSDPLAEVSPEFLSQLPPLGRTLLKGGRVSVEDLERALATSLAEGVRLGEVLMREGLIKESDLIWAMATELNLDFVDLDLYPVEFELASLLPESVARYNLGLPIAMENGTLVVAVTDPTNVVAMENLKLAMGGKPFKPVVVVRRQLELFISQAYNRGREAAVAAESAAAQDEEESQDNKVTDLQIVEDAPVIRYVNLIILQALNERASDIHIEPTPDKLRIRFRIDGVLHDMNAAPKNITSAVISRLKVLGGMDIAEHRVPQDGRSSIRLGERTIDLRLAAMPTVHGEKVVLRLLDKSQALLSLEELGFLPTMLERYVESYSKPYGTILVTGPTGSGKSTTLYATLNELNSANRNLITVEDPVEYQLPGISQVQVNVKSGLTFPVVLKSILRSDPDVILVGEIRDKETIVMVSEAALTGHLVLSTLHTNSAATTPMRLAEMGLEPYLITSAFNCVLTQRLARKLCVHCRRPVEVTEADLKAAGCSDDDIAFVGDGVNVFQAVGCRACSNTGYRGRLALGEVMLMSEEINRLVIDRATTEEIQRVAIQEGLVPLRNDGLRKVLLGMTTFEEVLRVVA